MTQEKIGGELIIDIDHYRRHPDSDSLWCVVFDPSHLLPNAEGLKNDLEGSRSTNDGTVHVRLLVLLNSVLERRSIELARAEVHDRIRARFGLPSELSKSLWR